MESIVRGSYEEAPATATLPLREFTICFPERFIFSSLEFFKLSNSSKQSISAGSTYVKRKFNLLLINPGSRINFVPEKFPSEPHLSNYYCNTLSPVIFTTKYISEG